MIDRRRMMVGLGGVLAVGSVRHVAAQERGEGERFGEVLDRLERRSGGRLGVAIRDGGGGSLMRRADERFPMASTFKALAAAAVLARVDAGLERLDRRVAVVQADLVDYSPVMATRVVGEAPSLAEICAAAITVSDNTAGNLLLDAIGGPEGLTAFLRASGDAVTRLDRREPALNEAAPGDPRDTTTPAAMAATVERLLFGDVLTAASRARLVGWMEADAVAGALLRAGLPKDWWIADKTGAGGNGARSIVAAVRPPGRGPVVMAINLAETTLSLAERNAVFAEIAAAWVRSLVV